MKEDKPDASCATQETKGAEKDRKEDSAANHKVEDERKKKNKKEKKENKGDERKKENKIRKSKSKETSEELKPDQPSSEQPQMNGESAVKSKVRNLMIRLI